MLKPLVSILVISSLIETFTILRRESVAISRAGVALSPDLTINLCRAIGEVFWLPPDVTTPFVSRHRKMKSFSLRCYGNVLVVAS